MVWYAPSSLRSLGAIKCVETLSVNQNSFFGKKCIVWKNPETGLPIAVLRDLDNYEIPLPNSLSSFEENFIHFQSLWTNLDFDLKMLYEDIGRHIRNNNEQCYGCNFPFSPVLFG